VGVRSDVGYGGDQELAGRAGFVRVLFAEDDSPSPRCTKLSSSSTATAGVASDGEMAIEMARRDPRHHIFGHRLTKAGRRWRLQALRANDQDKKVRVVILSNYSKRTGGPGWQSWACWTT